MKSLLDVQQDIRNLEKSVQEITNSIKCISTDIDVIRNSKVDTKNDFLGIEKLAKQFIFGKHPIDRLDDGNACKLYLEMLLNIVHLNPGDKENLNRKPPFIHIEIK